MAQAARKITNAGSRKNIGEFPSLKMQATVQYESLLERDYLYLLEIDSSVLVFTEQPFKINYTLNGRARTYTPDLFVERLDGKQVVEIKPVTKIDSEKNLCIFRKVAPICREQGWEFLVVTDATIRLQPRLNNIKLLHKYSRVPFTLQKFVDCQNYFENQQLVRLQSAERDLAPKQIGRQELFRLLYFGFLETNLMQAINSNSLLKLSSVQLDLNKLISL